jgi:hypothetical protein
MPSWKTVALVGALFGPILVWPLAAQNSIPSTASTEKAQPSSQAPTRKGVTFEEFVDATIQQEQRLTNAMRNFKPVVETYIQEQKHDSDVQTSPKSDNYFLSRLDLTGDAPANSEFESQDHSRFDKEKKLLKGEQPFAAVGFAQSVFPDLEHFDRKNYLFNFVRWEVLGDVRCAVIDVNPRENSSNRGFVGRVWVEDQDYNIVRFTGSYTSKEYSKRSFHFDSWRLNTLGITWMPAYVYTEESDPHDSSSHGLWFKAQTRIWGYDVQQAGDHHEYAKRLTDNPAAADPHRHEASQSLSPELTLGGATYTPEDDVVERLQLAGLMAPDGDVDRILETVINNLLITNNLDLAGIRCRVLLTTPLESFVIGRTIVVSRGLLDVLPDEATLAAVLSHELAHIVLRHSLGAENTPKFSVPFSDLEIFTKLNFQFDAAKEAAADKKGQELFSKSPYDNQLGSVALFLQALEARSPQLPNLLRARFSNDFGSSHLVGMQVVAKAPKRLKMDEPGQIAALPLGSRIKVDPWSDRIEMLKNKMPTLESASEKRPFEVSPFFPHLKRLEEPKKPVAEMHP